MKTIFAAAAIAALSAGSAQAGVAPVVIGDFTGISITETPLGTSGSYTLVNESTAAFVQGFGVTNPNPSAAYVQTNDGGSPTLDDWGDVLTNGVNLGNLWGAIILTESDWSTFQPFGEFSTMEDLFGAWDFGSDKVNWYEAVDAALPGPGETTTGFYFNGIAASDAFGYGFDNNGDAGAFFLGDISGATGPEVPLPAAAWMLIAGAGALGAAARRKG